MNRTKAPDPEVFESEEGVMLAYLERGKGRRIYPCNGGVWVLAATRLQALRAWAERFDPPPIGEPMTMAQVHETIKKIALTKMKETTLNGKGN